MRRVHGVLAERIESAAAFRTGGTRVSGADARRSAAPAGPCSASPAGRSNVASREPRPWAAYTADAATTVRARRRRRPSRGHVCAGRAPRHDGIRVERGRLVAIGLVREHLAEQLVLERRSCHHLPLRSHAPAQGRQRVVGLDFSLPGEQPRTSAICCSERSSSSQHHDGALLRAKRGDERPHVLVVEHGLFRRVDQTVGRRGPNSAPRPADVGWRRGC